MMDKMVEVKLTKCLLILPEKVIWKSISPAELAAGIRRGKQRIRGINATAREREKEGICTEQ